ncbi:MAG: protein jag [Oscillospiraceae bacterium]|nr:protein jag [Oscillospiraceae bacterium]
MARSIEISAKTVELATEKGALELGVAQENVTVELIESPKAGFLGIGAKPAKYLVSVIADEEPKKEEKKPAKKAEPKKEEKKAAPAPSAPAKEKVVVPADGDAAEFLTKVLSFICEDAKIQKVEGAEEGTVSLEIVGENLGGIIGRRGETLDALQHLVNLAVNRKSEGKTRIMLDAENYRAKRADSLEKFAQRAASQVLKYKRNKALEPMNAYERHIVHVALQDMENISTSSVGVEPNRRIIINYTGPDARPPRRRYSK